MMDLTILRASSLAFAGCNSVWAAPRPSRLSAARAPRRRPCSRVAPAMLRVQSRRRPEDWARRSQSLSGRFLPLDPGDEALLDELERDSREDRESETEYGPDGPPDAAYGTNSGPSWSKRADAAKKRWADPAYRANMLAKRAEKKRRDIEAGLIPNPEDAKRKVHIGRLDSITMSSEEKAKAINQYARSNKRRSEKIAAYHQNRATWMADRLRDGEEARVNANHPEHKKQIQEKRAEVARKRHARMKAENQLNDTPDEKKHP